MAYSIFNFAISWGEGGGLLQYDVIRCLEDLKHRKFINHDINIIHFDPLSHRF